ncbi:hypothetical protein L209DRAFT_135216 [Thermothelomyces heterothallicus CBS 203.75]
MRCAHHVAQPTPPAPFFLPPPGTMPLGSRGGPSCTPSRAKYQYIHTRPLLGGLLLRPRRFLQKDSQRCSISEGECKRIIKEGKLGTGEKSRGRKEKNKRRTERESERENEEGKKKRELRGGQHVQRAKLGLVWSAVLANRQPTTYTN